LTGWTVFGVNNPLFSVSTVRNTYTELRRTPEDVWFGTMSFNGQEGGQHLDLSGIRNTGLGGISQQIDTVIGQLYRLRFYIGNIDGGDRRYLGPASVSVQIDNGMLTPFENAWQEPGNSVYWSMQSYEFQATSARTTVAFLNTTQDTEWYVGLDDVVVELATPEPSTLLLLGAGLVGLAVLRRRS
jgi:hypothetical protein